MYDVQRKTKILNYSDAQMNTKQKKKHKAATKHNMSEKTEKLKYKNKTKWAHDRFCVSVSSATSQHRDSRH